MDDMPPLDRLKAALGEVLGDRVVALTDRLGELTLVVSAADHLEVATVLRDHPSLRFDTLLDLCGVDYLNYAEGAYDGRRFAAVVHLLSVELNQRLRLRTFCPEDDFPVIASLTGVWPAVGWFEREAFDLFGIVFEGHADLRRILTDYGFVGHPFRKDFPVSGYVEMRYDPEQRRVIYQPVTIEPREIVPRVIREEGYGIGR
jgi:NADH-quinone oxidoreductase subunit C